MLLATGNPLQGEQARQLARESALFFKVKNALLIYLQEFQSALPLKRCQLTLLGHGCSGKTTILRTLQDQKAPTISDRTRQVVMSDIVDKKSGLTYSVRELPGQQQFYAANSHFLPTGSAIVFAVVSLVKYHSDGKQGSVKTPTEVEH